MRATEPAGRRLPLVPTLAAYGGPQLPVSALLIVYGFFPVYYTQGLGLDFSTAAVLLLVTRLWDVVIDPVVGAASDRVSLAWGRRRPWLIAGVPLVVLGVAFVFFARPGASPAMLGLWTFVLYAGWTLVAVPLNAWGVDLSGDYHERGRIAAVREGFGLFGTVVALAILGLGAGGGADGLVRAFSILGAVLLLAFPLTVLVAARAVPDPPRPPVPRPPLMEEVRALGRNPALIRLTSAFFLNGFANGLPATLFVFFVQSVLAAPGQVGLFILVYFGCGIAGIPVWTRIARAMGKHRAWMASMVLAAGIFAPVVLLGPGDTGWYLAVCILTGFCLGADLFLPPAIQADVVDQDAVLVGQERTGLLFSLMSMLNKLAAAFAGSAALWALGRAGFDDGLGPDNAPAALITLAVLYGLVPAAIKLAAIAVMRGFPLDEAAQRRLRARLEAVSPPSSPRT